jgi:hypothetical protein
MALVHRQDSYPVPEKYIVPLCPVFVDYCTLRYDIFRAFCALFVTLPEVFRPCGGD